MTIIPSEQQAEELGEALTGGFRGTAFEVFYYVQKRSNLTLFMVHLRATNQIVKYM